MKIKINKRVVGIVLGVIAVAGIAGGIAFTVKKFKDTKTMYELQLASKDGEIAARDAELAEIGPITSTYQLAVDVKSGAQIDEEDFILVDIPEKYTYDENERPDGYITDINMMVNQRYKTNLSAGTIMTPALVYEDYLTTDLRFLDVTFDELPIGLEVGDYIDCRVRFIGGQDMIALKHKEVVKVYNTKTVRLLVSEIDIHTIRSITTDMSMYDGLQLYGVLYLDGGVQQAAEIYYPLRLDVLATIVQDPNIADEFDISAYSLYDRDMLEGQLISNMQAAGNEYYGEIINYLKAKRASLQNEFNQAQVAYEQAKANQASGSAYSAPASSFDSADQVYNN